MPGVTSAAVNLATETAGITGLAPPEVLIGAAARAGYHIPSIGEDRSMAGRTCASAVARVVRAAMHAGLVLQDRAIGVIRLYSRRPREFAESEKRLTTLSAAQAAVAAAKPRLMQLQQREPRLQR